MRAVLMITGSTYITYASGLLVSAMVARTLGPAEYGHYAYLVWIAGLVNILSNHGLTGTAIRFISESIGAGDASSARRLHGWLLLRQRASLLLVAVCFVLALPFLQPSGWQAHGLFFAAAVLVSAAAKSSHLFSSSVAKGYGQFGIEVRTTNMMSALNLAAIAVLFVMKAPLSSFVVCFVVINLGHMLMTLRSMHQAGLTPERQTLDPAMRERLKAHLGWSIAFALVASLGNRSIETFLLNRHTGAEAVAFFTVAGALTRGGADLLMAGINSTLLSTMAHTVGTGDRERLARISGDAVRYCHFLGLLLAGVGVLWARPLVMLMYGGAFDSAVLLMQVMVALAGLTLSSGVLGAILTSTENQRTRATVAFAAVLVNAVCALLLVPRLGLQGALGSHAIGTLLEFALMGLAALRVLKMRLSWIRLGTTTLAFALALAPCLALHEGASDRVLAQWASGFLFGALFLGLSIAFRAWEAHDFDVLAALARRKPALGPLVQWLQDRATR